MPIQKTEPLNNATYLGIWHLQETTEELRQQLLTLRPGHTLPDFKAVSRTREWLASRILAYTLLAELTSVPVVLERQETGQPVCSSPTFHVSLTHSGVWVGALVSATQRVGIDIELKGNKVERLVQKFLTEEEVAASAHDLIKMHVYWSAKESLYKLYCHKKLFFKENLLLQDFDRQPAGQFNGQIRTHNFAQSYVVQYREDLEYVLTYVLET